MLKWIESTGKSEEAAIEAALQKLGMDRDEVSVEVLERAKSGFLGIGSCPAKVKVTYKAPDEPETPAPVEEKAPVAQPVQEEKPAPAAEAEAPAAAPEPEYAEPEYYEEQPAEGGQRISTVEFAIAPKADTPEEEPAPAQEDLPDASALFEKPAAAPKKATRSRGGTAAKKTGTRKKAQPQQEDLPAAFDSFQGVDYND